MRRFALATAPLFLTLGALACASGGAQITDSWLDPSVTSVSFDKVLVIAVTPNESVRRAAEDAMVRSAQRGNAVASYTLLTSEQLGNNATVRSAIQQNNFDGAVTMRLVGKEQQTTWVPGSYPTPYYSFYGYHTYSYPMAYDPGYLRTDDIVKIETNVYSIEDDKLIWTGLSESFNPDNVTSLVSGIAEAIAQDMRDKGVML